MSPETVWILTFRPVGEIPFTFGGVFSSLDKIRGYQPGEWQAVPGATGRWLMQRSDTESYSGKRPDVLRVVDWQYEATPHCVDGWLAIVR